MDEEKGRIYMRKSKDRERQYVVKQAETVKDTKEGAVLGKEAK